MRAFEIFKQLCAIPHKSYHTKEMFVFLCKFCEDCGYIVQTDLVHNIYARKIEHPKICLQAHYDMVGVGIAESSKPFRAYIDGQYVCAKGSSLGADNGAAIGAILALIEQRDDIEVLFTNDEEVGLIGASNLKIPICSTFLLNLDSEFFGEIIVGCAGGFDAEVVFRARESSITPYMCEISAFGFLGGHSGIDINKGIPSCIVAFFNMLERIDSKILTICAGEKSNSIPVGLNAKILIHQNLAQLAQTFSKSGYKILLQEDSSPKSLDIFIQDNMGFSIRNLTQNTNKYECYDTKNIAKLILGLKHGVFVQKEYLVLSSLNIAMISQDINGLRIMLKARANTKPLLEQIQAHIQHICMHNLGERGIISNEYMPWERTLDSNNPILQTIIKAFEWRLVDIGEIHAGLECGILQERFTKMGLAAVNMASIGPTILNPHSINERLDLGSFEEFVKVLKNIIQRL